MPQYRLILQCDLEGIDTVYATDEASFAFCVECAHCRAKPDKPLYIDLSTQCANIATRSAPRDTTDRHTWKCTDCGREGSILLSVCPAPKKAASSFTVATADIRGALGIQNWDPKLTILHGHTFALESDDANLPSVSEATWKIDLSEGEWMDYDEANERPVEVTNLSASIQRE